MGSPVIFSGSRAKVITNKGLLLKSGQTIDNDGPINMVVDGGFESGKTTWSLQSTAGYVAGGMPQGTTTYVSLMPLDNTSPLEGIYSLRYTTASTWTPGHVVMSDQLYISTAASGKTLTASFDYKILAGASNMNLSGTSANTLHVVIQDVTNSKWIQPTNPYGINSTGSGFWSGTFQPDTTCTTFRICILTANANTSGTTTVNFDNFYVGRNVASTGAVVTDWVSYTPTVVTNSGTMTNYTATGKWKRIGDTAKFVGDITFTGAAGTWSVVKVSLPSGMAMDTSKMWPTPTERILGKASFLDAGTTLYGMGPVTYNSTTNVTLSTTSANGATAPVLSMAVQGTVPFTWNTGDSISFQFEAPISGWSSNVQLSSDAGNSYVLTDITATTQALTANVTNIVFSTVNKDTSGSFSSTTFTVPSPGDYLVNLYGNFSANAGIDAYVNGVSKRRVLSSGAAGTFGGSAVLINLLAGQAVTFRSVTSLTLNAMEMTIQKVSNPQTIAASDTVAASYYLSANQGITANSTRINYDTKIFDYQGSSVTTGASWAYTAQLPGLYSVEVRDQVAASSTSYIVQTGSVSAKHPGAAQTSGGLLTVATFRMITGDQFYVLNNTTQTIGGGIDGTIGYLSKITVKRVGN